MMILVQYDTEEKRLKRVERRKLLKFSIKYLLTAFIWYLILHPFCKYV